MDRWSIVTTLNYLPHDKEVDIVSAKAKAFGGDEGAARSPRWCASPDMTRSAFINGDLSTVMSRAPC